MIRFTTLFRGFICLSGPGIFFFYNGIAPPVPLIERLIFSKTEVEYIQVLPKIVSNLRHMHVQNGGGNDTASLKTLSSNLRGGRIRVPKMMCYQTCQGQEMVAV